MWYTTGRVELSDGGHVPDSESGLVRAEWEYGLCAEAVSAMG